MPDVYFFSEFTDAPMTRLVFKATAGRRRMERMDFLGGIYQRRPTIAHAIRRTQSRRTYLCYPYNRWLFLFWRERSDDFFEAWIAAQRVPKREQFQLAISGRGRIPHGDGKLFAGEVFVTDPRSDHR